VQGLTKYYTFGGTPIALRQGTGTGGALTYLSGDYLGSVSLATSSTGAMMGDLGYPSKDVCQRPRSLAKHALAVILRETGRGRLSPL